MSLWSHRSLVPLLTIFASPSFLENVGKCWAVWRIFLDCDNARWMAWTQHWRFLALARILVVSAVKSSGSSLIAVSGRGLRVCSKKKTVVPSTSSVRLPLWEVAIITSLQLWTSLSQIPRNCGAPGGLNFKTILFWAKSFSIIALFHTFIIVFNLLVSPTKRVPMVMQFRYELLSLLDKWRGSTISSRCVVGTSLR